MNIYMDHAATTPCDGGVLRAMLPYLRDSCGNASSQHGLGQEARAAVEEARRQTAELIGAGSGEIVFTSGGTEANNLAVKGAARALKAKGNHIIISSVEHHSVLEAARQLEKEGFEVTCLPVDQYGRVDPEDVSAAVTDKTVLVSVMRANNEVGTLQPVEEIGKILEGRQAYFHVDAVQAAGSVPVDVNELGADLLSVSAHKFYGPKGAGALYVRPGAYIEPLLRGGDQEGRRRAGTENVPGIAGLGEAARMAKANLKKAARLAALRDRLADGIAGRVKGVRLNGHPTQRLPGIVNVSVRYVEGESMVMRLDALGVAASSGSACSSTDLRPSHVLLAMGLKPELAHGSLRFSLGRDNTEAHVDRVLEALPAVVEKLRAMSPLTIKEKAHV